MVRFILTLLAALVLFANSYAGQMIGIADLRSWLDFSCIDFKVEGICIKHKHGRIKVGIKVSYYLPVAVVEEPPVPYETMLAPLRPALKASEPLVSQLVSKIPMLSGGPYEFGGNIEGVEDTYYREVHIFSSPVLANPALSLLTAVCDRPDFSFFVWFSETDPIEWRLGLKDYLKGISGLPAKARSLLSYSTSAELSPESFASFLKEKLKSFKEELNSFSQRDWKNVDVSFKASLERIDELASKVPDGGWGSKFPHIGYVHDVSSTIAYHLIAVRALDYAFPLKPRWHKDKFQMIYPVKTGCYKIGSDRIKTEAGKMLKGDTPVWIYWYKFKCCVF
ncbi:hypothetical protein [Thermovibrio sp.]